MKEKTRVEQWIPLAHKIAISMYKQKYCRGFELGDFIGAAYEGLMLADEKFNENFGKPFKEYAALNITNAIFEMKNKEDLVKRSHYKIGIRTETDQDVGLTLEAKSENSDLIIDMYEAIDHLKPLHKKIIFGILNGYKMREIGKQIGKSHQYLYLEYEKALTELRRRMKSYKN